MFNSYYPYRKRENFEEMKSVENQPMDSLLQYVKSLEQPMNGEQPMNVEQPMKIDQSMLFKPLPIEPVSQILKSLISKVEQLEQSQISLQEKLQQSQNQLAQEQLARVKQEQYKNNSSY
jgi:hypothetical protein